MCMYNNNDIQRALERANDILCPLYVFCNPIHFQDMKKELSGTIYEIVANPNVEINKIYIINKADLKIENSDLPKIDLSELKEFIDKGGDK